MSAASHPGASMEAAFAEALNRGDVDGMMEHFDDRSVFVPGPPDGPVRGLKELRAAMAGLVASNGFLDVRTVKVQEAACGTIALLWLVWSFSSDGPDGERVTAHGRSPKVVHLGADGRWISTIDNPFYELHYYNVEAVAPTKGASAR